MKTRVAPKKAEVIRKVFEFDGILCKSAYGYVLTVSGAIEKWHNGSCKRELYATAEEVEWVRKNKEGK